MAGKNAAVIGIYASMEAAERALDTFLAAGFRRGDVSVLLAEGEAPEEFVHHGDTKAPESATAGATAGGVIGGTLGVLAGVGALAVPQVAPLVAAGPVMAGLAGFGLGGAVGGLLGALIGMGLPEYDAERYVERLKEGGTLLSVHCETSRAMKQAKHLFKATWALDIAAGIDGPKLKTRSNTAAV
jgi:hypothetical protein